MADIIHVDTGAMRSAAVKFKSCQQEMENAYLTMSNAVRELDSTWNGEASEAFKNQFNDLYKNIEQTEAKVEDAATEITQAAELYDVQEDELTGTFSGLDVGTSPFN